MTCRRFRRAALLLVMIAGACGAPPADIGTGDMGGAPAPDMAGPDSCQAVSCPSGFLCKGGACAVDPARSWVITVTNGLVSAMDPNGIPWDPLGGKPDPYLCLTYLGNRRCTAYKDDTLQASWNESFPAAPANNLLGGVIVELWDKDVPPPDDPICPATLVLVTAQDLKAGTWGAMCQYGSFQATLRLQ